MASSTRTVGLPTSTHQQMRCLSKIAPVKWFSRLALPFSFDTPLRQEARVIGAAVQSRTATTEPSTAYGIRVQEPTDARSAIALGLRLYEDSQFEVALDLFSRALTLPGTGLKRFRDKPREASDAERISMLYNAACCLSRLHRQLDGLEALAGALEAGFEDVQQIRRDPDLATLREHPAFEGLLARFEKPKGLLSDFLRGFHS